MLPVINVRRHGAITDRDWNRRGDGPSAIVQGLGYTHPVQRMCAIPTTYQLNDVFVPGGLPQFTYVTRTELEGQVTSAFGTLCKILTVTGPTKSGKTVLVRKVLGSLKHVWLDGGRIRNTDEFWDEVCGQLTVSQSLSHTISEASSREMQTELEAEVGVVVAKTRARVVPKSVTNESQALTRTMAISSRHEALTALKTNRIPIVIDDFHYLKRDVQGQIARIFKPLVFDGVPVIFLAIPHRRFDAVKVEQEMNGRIESVRVPHWDIDELTQIAQLGFPLLNVEPAMATSRRLAKESNGSPHLMQEFCKKICVISKISATTEDTQHIAAEFDHTKIFQSVARDLGKNIFERLARGPAIGRDRKLLTLRDTHRIDVYGLVLLALTDVATSGDPIPYEKLRASIRELLQDAVPTAQEITRVLKQMAKISASDESSIPVIDYEDDVRQIHITDPFFAFVLKWGRHLLTASASAASS
jgi:hypothetical protein